ncbi:MAG: S8 family serine peptidase [Micromonosporaceae bacterium]|nr:S8 family serine peptidase [Micromonosporaceae bacterium]
MAENPAATAAQSKAPAGTRFNAHSKQATDYSAHLRTEQDAALKRAGVDPRTAIYHYTNTFNGVAVKLTPIQVAKLQHDSTVVRVWKNQILTTDALTTPDFLGLTGKDGVWKKQFHSDQNAGLGVIVADIDTGFWPESPSLAPLPEPRPDASIISQKWHGTCDTSGESPVTCNNKVIGARFFDSAGLSTANPHEFTSPRDFDGHGTHTTTTAAGDFVSHASAVIGDVGPIEGVAPAARVAIYKVLYENAAGDSASGSTADIAAAVDQAVADGVDVINMSLGGSSDQFSFLDLATLNATQAGVFVAMAGGNAGPGAATITNDMPWETTVAAGTHNKLATKSFTLGNGVTYTGVGVGGAVASSPLVDAAQAAAPGHSASDANLCFEGALDPAKVTGAIVLCQRGTNARVAKSAAVKEAGGVGMIMWNPSPQSVNADFHSVPSVHVDTATGQAVRAYIAGTTNPTASIAASVTKTVEAPAVTDFSSRGPTVNGAGSLIKPDILAPGNDVIAGVSPLNHGGGLYDTESGTSQATPHIAGIAALLKSKHQDWSPMWIKSAIMTTANQKDSNGKPIADQGTGGNATPLAIGSGQVVPAAAFDPGLVYDSDIVQWVAFTCGIGIHLGDANGNDLCNVTGELSGTDLNYPSISIPSLINSQAVTRTVTNVDRKLGIYVPKVVAPAGYTASVSPRVLVVQPHKTASYTVTLTRTDAAFNQFAFGSITWSDLSGHKVYSPIAVKSVELEAPAAVSGTGTDGTTAVSLTPGFTGTLTATPSGLAADQGVTTPLVQDDAGFDPNNPAAGPGTAAIPFTVPAGTKLARVATFASDYVANTDVDVFVYAKAADGSLSLFDLSAGGTADEQVDITRPGDYVAFVDVFANPTGSTIQVQEHQWIVPPTAGSLTATPASQSVTGGTAATVTLGWSGLTAGSRYLGVLDYGDGTNTIGQTVVAVSS